MIGVDIVSDTGQENQIEEPLSHPLLEVRCEDPGCLVHGGSTPTVRVGHMEQLFPVPELRQNLKCFGDLSSSIFGQEFSYF